MEEQMSIEAMKQALEALEEIHPGNMTPMAEEAWNKAITALRTAIEQAEKQEPVAKKPCPACGGPLVECQHCEGEGYEPGTDNDVTGPALCRECGGLGGKRNTTPPAAQSQDSGIETVAAKGGLLPKREWVGLTDEEIAKATGFCEFTTESTKTTLTNIARAIESKLKEKNT
jgi:hypothetical protein